MSEATEPAASSKSGDGTPPNPGYPAECDLVMKGGITSGIIYPLAIVEIAKAFQLRSIGGTSAGAIAAAAAAAAELGRQRFKASEVAQDPGGFDTLGKLPDHLCAPSSNGRGTKLLAFFKPKAELKAIFDAFTSALAVTGWAARSKAVLVALLWHYRLAAVGGLLLGSLPLWFLPWSLRALPAWIWLGVFAALVAAGLVTWSVVRCVVAVLPAHGFGVCSGMPDATDPAPDEALTEWLASYLDGLAGQPQAFEKLKKPLTFGDLKAHRIDLQVMTTCLTLGRPFRLPFRDDEHVRENKQFLFMPSEFEQLFPAYVVDWMKAHERPYPKEADGKSRFAQADCAGLVRLPDPDDLPVVVAIRMSLSFPLLLSAVPLHTLDFRKPAVPGERPERCWFTDGGVGSNFPIHFFDAPLPTRPTFGLDLGLTQDSNVPRVVFPKTNADALFAWWRRFAAGGGLTAIVGFLGTVVSVAKDWNHEMLTRLPGFRDRIGLIRLTQDEGGLNLTMPAERIRQLTRYGREAGLEFVHRFADPAKSPLRPPSTTMNWENHQHIRLRLILAATSEMLTHLDQAVTTLAGTPQSYARFFVAKYEPKAYRFTGLGSLVPDAATGLHTGQAGLASWVLDDLMGISQRIAKTIAANPTKLRIHPGAGAPKPTPELKLRPRV